MSIIITDDISRDVVIVERWHGRLIMVWVIVRKPFVWIMSVYGPETGRAEGGKMALRKELEKMIGEVYGQENKAGRRTVNKAGREIGEEL